MAKQLKDRTIYPAWDCGVFNNKVVIKDRQAFDKHLIPFEGKDNLQLIIKRKVKGRSRQEEKFYHAVVVRMIAAHMDITDQEAHDFLKNLWLKKEVRQKLQDGRVVRYERTGSTTELGDKAYREYWQTCIKWAALPTKDEGLGPDSGLGLVIPYPNEVWYDEYNETGNSA
jgi:hypothetical protein